MKFGCLFKLDPAKQARWLPAVCFAVALSTMASELPDPVEAGWHGKSVCEVLREDAEVRIFRWVSPLGVGHERHFHQRHFGYALSGRAVRITNYVSTREVALKAGSYFSSEGIEWH